MEGHKLCNTERILSHTTRNPAGESTVVEENSVDQIS